MERDEQNYSKEFKPLTDVEMRMASSHKTMGRRVAFILGVVVFMAAFAEAGYFKEFPSWVSLALFLGGGFLIAKGRGAL